MSFIRRISKTILE